eukprot:4164792-Prymnesium_polylepis.1
MRALDFGSTVFPTAGTCRDVGPKMIHQYQAWYSGPGVGGAYEVTWHDLIDDSCLNGWACGNIAASAGDVATFYYELLRNGSRLVTAASQ